MDKIEFPQLKTNGIYYYVNQSIIILRVFIEVHMVKVKCRSTEQEFVVDINALSFEPISEASISIKLLGSGVE